MLFLSLILYIILWYPANIFLLPRVEIFRYAPIQFMIVLYLLSFLIAYFLVMIFDTYHPPANKPLKKMLPLKGVKHISFFIAASAFFIIIFALSVHRQSYLLMGWLVPVAIISFLNSIGIDFLPKALREEEKPDFELPSYVPGKMPSAEQSTEIDRSGNFLKKFFWKSDEKEFSLELYIRRSEYEKMRKKMRVDFSRWAEEYVSNGICTEVRELAHILLKKSPSQRPFDFVKFVLRFVQGAIKYELDEVHHTKEYPKYPVETLVEERGDCEDAAILGAAILKATGYDVALIALPNHIALGIAGTEEIPGRAIRYEFEEDGVRKFIDYYYCEMTAEGWNIGDAPQGALESAEIIPVPDIKISLEESV